MFEILFLHEALDPWSCAGTVLILGYMLVVALVKRVKVQESTPTEKGMLLPPEERVG